MNPYKPQTPADMIRPAKSSTPTKIVMEQMIRSALGLDRHKILKSYEPVSVPAPDMRPKGTAEERAARREKRKANEARKRKAAKKKKTI